MESVNLQKQVYGRSTYTKVIDTKFTEFAPPPTGSSTPTDMTVEEFFDQYEQLFFSIPATGEVNSHEYLIKKSTEFVGATMMTDTEQAYIDEINSLRQQLLESTANYLNLNEVI